MRALWLPRRRPTALAGVLLAVTVSASCHRSIAPPVEVGRSAVALSGGPNTSMMYLARTSDGVLAIDLGWWGQSRALSSALKKLDATPTDIHWVFLTHSHRDHIAAWRQVRHARFVLAASEEARLFGQSPHGGWIPRWADRLWPPSLPRRGDVVTTGLAMDTAFVFGSDTLHAYPAPGHTPGSMVYLFRGVLFVGDAMTFSHWRGFGPAKRGFTDDRSLAVRSLAALWARLPAGAVRYVCTAHAHCAAFTPDRMKGGAK
jgi:glyoxylase-like metal-dependent hydrolase (beta-lactamase superfamily II)